MARRPSGTMLRGTLTHRLDRDLARYVLRDERVVVAVRQHWMANIRPFAVGLLTLIAAVWTDVRAPRTPAGATMSQLLWFLWLAAMVWVAWRVLNWRRDWFVATDKRFLMFYGFITRKVAMMPLAKVTDLTFNRTILGRLLGYGDFTLESAGQHQALGHIDYIPQADQHYREICAVLFSDDDESDPSDADGFHRRGSGEDGFGRGGFDGGGFGGGGFGGGGPANPRPPAPDGGRGGPGGPRSSPDDGYAVSEARAFGVPVRPSMRPGRHRSRSPEGETERGATAPAVQYLYRSSDSLRSARRADTDEIPVVQARPLRGQPPGRRGANRPVRDDRGESTASTEELLYPPEEWLD